MATCSKEVRDSTDGPLVHHSTLVQENQVVKRLKDLTGRLVNREEHTRACISDLLENLAELHG